MPKPDFVQLNILFPFHEGIEMLYEDRTNLAMITVSDDSKLCVYLNDDDEIQLRHLFDEVDASLLKLTAQHIMHHQWDMLVKVNRAYERVANSIIQLAETDKPMIGNSDPKRYSKKLVKSSFCHPISVAR